MAKRTALDCLVAIARHHGLDLSAERIAHDFALDAEEPTTAVLTRVVRECGLRARVARLDWDALLRQPHSVFPIMLRLTNGNTVVALGFTTPVAPRGESGSDSVGAREQKTAGAPELIVADPLADGGKHLPVGRTQLESVWQGELILSGRAYALGDENQPFGLRWFLPEALRQKSLLRDVIVAALVLHVVALALPIYFQIVIDKALTHQSYSTLYVLSIGAVLCVLFEAAFGFVRQYLLLYASNRIDLRISARVFAHLLSLAIILILVIPCWIELCRLKSS